MRQGDMSREQTMENKDLHDFIKAFDIKVPETAAHKSELRSELLVIQKDRQIVFSKIFSKKLQSSIQLKEITYNMKLNLKTFSLGFASLALVAAMVFIQTVSSPHAQAMEIASKGISMLSNLNTEELSKINSRFSGDPKNALDEAMKAKNLTSITKDEYEGLVKNAHMQIKTIGNGPMPEGGTMSSGFVNPDGTGQSNDSSNTSPNTKTIKMSDIEGQAPASGQIEQQAQVTQVNDDVSIFIKYTDSSDNIVVIGFNKSNTPVFRSMFKI